MVAMGPFGQGTCPTPNAFSMGLNAFSTRFSTYPSSELAQSHTRSPVAIEAIVMLMAVYLAISLLISLFMNWYNARVRLVER